jgi:hypothetical protein
MQLSLGNKDVLYSETVRNFSHDEHDKIKNENKNKFKNLTDS